MKQQQLRRKNRFLAVLLCLALTAGGMLAGIPTASAAGGDGVTQYYALLVVTSNLDLDNSPMHDAQTVAAALTHMQTPDGRPIPRENIQIVNEPDVTTDNFDTVIRQSFSQMDEDDFGMVFYSGHGVYGDDEGFSESYLTFQNKNGNWGYYPAASLAQTLNALPGKFLVYLASCYSGGFIAKREMIAREQTAAQPDLFFNREKFFVISAASALQMDFSEGGTLNIDGSIRAFAGALGINPQSYYVGGKWQGENQPMGTFAADTDQDGQLTFHEITQWVKENTVSNSVQCYPENSEEPLFSYASDDSRPGAIVTDISVDNQIALPGDSVTLELTCLDDEIPEVSAYCMNRMTGATIAYDMLTAQSLGNHRYRYTAVVESSWENGVSCFELYHSKQGLMNRIFAVTGSGKAPVTALKDFEPQPTEIIPLQGREYRVTLSFDTPCWFDVQICNDQGQTVRTLAEHSLSVVKGDMASYCKTNSYYWDGTDDQGKAVANGVYQIRARAYNAWGEQTVTGVTPAVAGSVPAVEIRNITMRVGSTYAVVNGEVSRTTINNGVYTTIKMLGGKTMVPVRYISEATGLRVDWDGAARSATVTNPVTGEYLVVQLDHPVLKKYAADGSLLFDATMEVPPCLIDSSTYVPVRIVAECLGYQVEYKPYTDGERYVLISNRSVPYTQEEILEFCAQASGKI